MPLGHPGFMRNLLAVNQSLGKLAQGLARNDSGGRGTAI